MKKSQPWAQKPELISKIRIACRIQKAEYGSPTNDGQRASSRSARSWDAKLNEYGIDIGGFTMVPPWLWRSQFLDRKSRQNILPSNSC